MWRLDQEIGLLNEIDPVGNQGAKHERTRVLPWRWDINDRMKVGQNHIYLTRSVKQKLFDQGFHLFRPLATLEGLKD